ncbi:MAG: alpha/beta hydrolase [Dehalococcoidia bacterium]|nr:alpha/beta hydrolase [Dehalococcoidia bacterium]
MPTDKPQGLRQEQASIGGKRISFWVGGSGQPLVLLHGVAGDANLHWNRNFKRLTTGFTVYAPDLPGFGNSAPLASPTLTAYVDWLHAFLEFHKLNQTILVGHSMGASIARVYAAKSPAMVPGLVLVDGGHVPQISPTVKLLMKVPFVAGKSLNRMKRLAFDDARIKAMMHNQALCDDEFIAGVKRYEAQFIPIVRRMLVTPPPTQLTPECPVLVLWGNDDRFESADVGKQLAELIPNAVFETIENAGHMSMLDKPKEFSDLIFEYTDQLNDRKQTTTASSN